LDFGQGRRRSTHRIIWITLAAAAALVAAGTATAIIIYDAPQPLDARVEARAIGAPHITPRPAIGRAGVKIEADYRGTFTTVEGEQFALTLRLERLVDRDRQLGAAEGRWTLTSIDGGSQGSGELVAVDEVDDLHGMLLGTIAEGAPPEPDKTLRLLANFSASLGDGGNRLTGAIGNPNIAPNPAVLTPPGPC